MLITSIQNRSGKVYTGRYATIEGMEDSIFTKIIKGEIPCNKVYEDEKTLAFLDINPVAEGHTLVVSKSQVEFVWDLEDEDYQALTATVKKVAGRLKQVIGKQYVGEVVIGVDVPHAHIHLIPFNQAKEMKRLFDTSGSSGDPVDLVILAEKLHFS